MSVVPLPHLPARRTPESAPRCGGACRLVSRRCAQGRGVASVVLGDEGGDCSVEVLYIFV